MSGHVTIFAGPSLHNVDLVRYPELEFRPPCQQGDIYLATLSNPKAIGIIDGYFEGVPSVWHKEILYALSVGIHVFGASSMGALRAAELAPFGMVGTGEVFRSYHDGAIEDDDEVALVHGPEELGFPVLSEAMVNVRATMWHALQAGALEESQAEAIIETAKAIYYKERTWESIMSRVEEIKGKNACPPAFDTWLDENRIDQKSADAIDLLNILKAENFQEPFRPNFEFERTEFWHRCIKDWERNKNQPALQDNQPSDGYRLFQA